MGVLVQGGNDAAETKKKKKKKKMRYHICTEINRSFFKLIQHVCIKNDNLHKQYFKFTQGSVFLIISTIFVF